MQRSCGWKAPRNSEARESKAERLEGRVMVWGSLVTTLQMPILILGRDTRERLPKKKMRLGSVLLWVTYYFLSNHLVSSSQPC